MAAPDRIGREEVIVLLAVVPERVADLVSGLDGAHTARSLKIIPFQSG